MAISCSRSVAKPIVNKLLMESVGIIRLRWGSGSALKFYKVSALKLIEIIRKFSDSSPCYAVRERPSKNNFNEVFLIFCPLAF